MPLLLQSQTSCNCGSEVALDAGSGYNSYLWSNGATTQVLTIDPSCPSSSTSYSVTVSDDCGSDTVTHIVSVCNSSQITINDVFYSNGNNCILIIDAPNCCENPQYEWIDPCGSIVSTSAVLSSGGPQGNQITVCGIYTAKLVSCNGCTECSKTTTYNITANGGGGGLNCCGGSCGCTSCTANITGGPVNLFCGSTANYTATSCTGSTLSWEAKIGATTISTGSGTTFSFTPSTNGTYDITLTIIDDCGITTTDNWTTTVSGCSSSCQNCTSSSITPNNTPSCNQSTTFSISCSNTSSFTWSITGGGGTPSGNSLTFTPTTNGTYTVTVNFIDECGNNITKDYSFTISDCITCAPCTPSNITVNNTPSCNQSSIFTVTCGGITAINWSITGGGGTPSGNNFTYTPTSNGSYTVTATFPDGCGGSIIKTYNFTIAGCSSCDCTPTLTFNSSNCVLDLDMNGPNCAAYNTFTLLKWGNNGCGGGNTAYQSGSTTSFPMTTAVSDDTGFELVIFSNTCSPKSSGCEVTFGCGCNDNPIISNSAINCTNTLYLEHVNHGYSNKKNTSIESNSSSSTVNLKYRRRVVEICGTDTIDLINQVLTSEDLEAYNGISFGDATGASSPAYIDGIEITNYNNNSQLQIDLYPIASTHLSGVAGSITPGQLDYRNSNATWATAMKNQIINALDNLYGLSIGIHYDLNTFSSINGSTKQVAIYWKYKKQSNWYSFSNDITANSFKVFRSSLNGWQNGKIWQMYFEGVLSEPFNNTYSQSCGNLTSTIDVFQNNSGYMSFVNLYDYTNDQIIGFTGNDINETNTFVQAAFDDIIDSQVCQYTELTINNECLGASYLWSTGETTKSIKTNITGTITCQVTCPDGCVYNRSITI